VFSFLFQNGKCKTCGQKISFIYPVMELLCGLLFVFAYYKIGPEVELVVALTLISLLLIITVSDLAYMIIPNKVLIVFLVLFMIERFLIPVDPWYDPLLGAIIGFGLLFLIGVISKGGMGGGDIKLFGVLGLALGWSSILLTFFFAALIGTVVGIIGMLLGKVKRKKPIPFGPSIAAGSLLAYFYGDTIIHWYITTILN
jgi:leader peptidase (prepilin peptidase) / N-methyltransferase